MLGHSRPKFFPYMYNVCTTPVVFLGSPLYSFLGIICVKAFILSGAKLIINTSFKEFSCGKVSRSQMESVVQRESGGERLFLIQNLQETCCGSGLNLNVDLLRPN